MPSYIVSHDLGTTGDKATLFSDEGRLIASVFSEYATYYPAVGWAEQDPEDYWNAFCASTKKLLDKTKAKASDIAVVSFSGQMMAALPVTKNGDALRNSIIWADLRSTAQARKIGSRVGEDRVYRLTGHRLSASYSATKIMWIREKEPDVYARVDKFIHAKDFVVLKLTGAIFSDFSDASGMNLLDIRELEWSEELMEAAGIERDKLPELVESVSVVGKVKRDAAAMSGLAEGTPVVIGGGDGACATCGAGVVKEGEAYVYLGTSTWMGLATEEPIIDPEKRTFTFCHFRKGLYMPAGTMQTGGGSLGWFKNELCGMEQEAAEWAGVDVYDLITLKAKTVPCGSGGLLFLPYLMGERSPWWNPGARGCFIGLTVLHTKSHLARAVLEGVAFNMRIIGDAFKEQGVRFDEIQMIGGGARSDLWRSIFADVMEVPSLRLNFIEEATSVGAAIAGGVGVGLFSSIHDIQRFVKVEEKTPPDGRNIPIYRKQFALFRESYRQLCGVFEKLSSGDEA